MAYSRSKAPGDLPEGKRLTVAMVGIGMGFAEVGIPSADIEETLLAASVEGMDGEDFRVLSVLMTWLGVHSAWVNADRLTLFVTRHPSERVRAFWSSVGHWLCKDRRFARIGKAYKGPPMDLLATGTEFHLKRSGADPRFQGTPLRVPAGVLRNREGDVLSPEELLQRHQTYRRRIELGPSYRADMWAALDQSGGLSAAELARITHGSYATAWHVKRDWELLQTV